MSWQIDHRHSYVGFAIKHMMIAFVRGQFTRYRATIDLDLNNLTRSCFEGEIEVASINTHVPERDRQLISADFFDAARYPTITFHSTRVEAKGGDRFSVAGELTLHGVTREVTLDGAMAGAPVRSPWGELRTGFSATTTINREDFGLTWNRIPEGGGVLIGNEVQIQLDIELEWQDEATSAT